MTAFIAGKKNIVVRKTRKNIKLHKRGTARIRTGDLLFTRQAL